MKYSLLDFIKVNLFVGVLLALILVIVSAVPVSLPAKYSDWFLLLLFIVQYLIFLVPLYYLYEKKRLSLKDFGFRKVKKASKLEIIATIAFSYLFFIGFMILVQYIMLVFDIQIPGFGEQQEILPYFSDTARGKLVAFITIVIIAPVVEELFFRGFFLETLLKHTNTIIASIATAALFSAFHLDPSVFFPLFIIGLILNYLYIRFKSTNVTIIMHALNNFIAYILLFFVMV